MATVQLVRYECGDGGLPDVCVRCGAGANHFQVRHFTRMQPWTWLLLIAGIVPFVVVVASQTTEIDLRFTLIASFLPFTIAAVVTTKRRRVVLPLCADHDNSWQIRASKITNRTITLYGLHESFVLALEDFRKEEDRRYYEEREKRRRERDRPDRDDREQPRPEDQDRYYDRNREDHYRDERYREDLPPRPRRQDPEED